MKTTVRLIGIIFLTLIISGCDENKDTIREGSCYGFSKHKFDNHQYIVFQVVHGVHFIHSPDCRCKKKGDGE